MSLRAVASRVLFRLFAPRHTPKLPDTWRAVPATVYQFPEAAMGTGVRVGKARPARQEAGGEGWALLPMSREPLDLPAFLEQQIDGPRFSGRRH